MWKRKSQPPTTVGQQNGKHHQNLDSARLTARSHSPLAQVTAAIANGKNNVLDIALETGLQVTLVQAIVSHLERSGQLDLWQAGKGALSACAGCSGCGTGACAVTSSPASA